MHWLERGDSVVGFDSVNDYYDPDIKNARLDLLKQSEADYTFIHANLADLGAVNDCFETHQFDRVIHLAAQAGVRYSLENPHAYVKSNITGFTNILAGEPVQVFTEGKHSRDFTYIDDIVEGVIRASDDIAQPDANWNSDEPDRASSNAPFRLFDIGNNNPVKLTAYIEAIEHATGMKAAKELLPLQLRDVPDTFADVSEFSFRLLRGAGEPGAAHRHHGAWA